MRGSGKHPEAALRPWKWARFACSMEADGGAKGRHLLKTTLMTCEEEEKRETLP